MSNSQNGKRPITPEQLEKLMDLFQSRLSKEPLDIRNAINHISFGVLNGSSWAFISEHDLEYSRALPHFKASKVVTCYEIKGGVLIEMPLSATMSILSRVLPELYGNTQKEEAVDKRKEANTALLRFVQGLAKEGKSAKIGIYNLNDTPNLTINGVVLKSFNVTLPELCVYLEQFGYGIKIGGKVVPAKEIRKPEKIGVALRNLELAPSLRGILVEIARV